jgi:hypothetical protein
MGPAKAGLQTTGAKPEAAVRTQEALTKKSGLISILVINLQIVPSKGNSLLHRYPKYKSK